MRILMLLIGAFVLAVIAALAWFLQHEVVIFWLSFILNFVKGLTFRVLLGWLGYLVYRFVLIEVPKVAIFFLAKLHTPPRYRYRLERLIKRNKRLLRRKTKMLRWWLHTPIGIIVVANLGVILTIVVCYIVYLHFDIYIVYVVGIISVVRATGWLWSLLTDAAPVFLIRSRVLGVMQAIAMYFVRKLPATWQRYLTVQRRKFLVGIKHRRDRFEQRTERIRMGHYAKKLINVHKMNLALRERTP